MAFAQRPLTDADLDQMWEVEREAFNADPAYQEWWRKWEREIGLERIEGLFEDGRLVAMGGVLGLGQWFGGRSVPMGGLRAVAVRPERRGRGHVTRVLRAMLEAMRVRGETISTLYATVMRPYRRLGWEIAGAITFRQVPTHALAVKLATDLPVRRATEADRASIRDRYARVARTTNGWVDRTDGRWKWIFERFADDHLYVAGDDGYLLYRHLPLPTPPTAAEGFQILVPDLVASRPESWQALVALLGAAASVAPTTYFRDGPIDLLSTFVSAPGTSVTRQRPWLLRLVDASAAVAARGYPDEVRAAVPLEIHDPACSWNAGRFTLVVEGGSARLEPGGTGSIRLGIGALSSLFTGYATTAVLARAGLVDGGSNVERLALDRVFAGPMPWMIDEF